MWIYDIHPSGDGVDLWIKEKEGRFRCVHEPCPTEFCLSLPDPHAHWQLIEELEERYGALACTFSTIYGPCEGYRVPAGREVAEAVERQTRYAAHLYNVDVRREQRYFAETGRFPCGYPGERPMKPDFSMPLTVLEARVDGTPHRDTEITCAEVAVGGRSEVIRGRDAVGDLFGLFEAHDPDVILFPDADHWAHLMLEKAKKQGITETFSRNGRLRRLGSRSYWSYGRREYRAAAVIPEGRLLIDTRRSFVCREGGLQSVLLASRLTGLSPNLTSRFTPGTLISAYEISGALQRGIAVPFRKRDPERLRGCDELRTADRGGMMFQPAPGLYGRCSQIDFTSLYPTIIVKYNLSPETIAAPHRRGFLPEVLAPLLEFRIMTKKLKKTDPGYSGIDSVLKWMLVTCFGYTGYRNAKFGAIEMHERITAVSRDILLKAKQIAEQSGYDVLHGIVDCIWVRGGPSAPLKERIESLTGIQTECEEYDWLVFLPQADGSGAYNRYYGRLTDGSVKVRGLLARRKDMPPCIENMQRELLAVMAGAASPDDLRALSGDVESVYRRYRDGISHAAISDLVVQRRISRLSYAHNCLEAAAVHAFRQRGISLSPGMEIEYVVRDARRHIVDPAWDAAEYDRAYYLGLVERAWDEIAYAFRCPTG